jgi:hypothetical protein
VQIIGSGEQSEQIVAFCLENVPLEQVEHITDPLEFEKNPGEQIEQEVEFSRALNDPAEHGVQTLFFTYDPAEQPTHRVFAVLLVVPEVHDKQLVELAVLYFPEVQRVQTLLVT